jgi:ATP-dependent protease HslVU (ClpYQ) peptidase subunit
MTVIVGIAHNNKIYIGGDRGASESGYLGASSNPKVFRTGDLLIGGSGSSGTMQLIQSLQYSKPDPKDLNRWIRMDFCRTIQDQADTWKIDLADRALSDFLLGVEGRLFEISTEDWSAFEYTEIATGSGYHYALGSLYSTRDWENPRQRVKEALQAAIRFSGECAAPIDILAL